MMAIRFDHHLNIYLMELEFRVKCGRNHASFLDLDMKIENSAFVYKLFDNSDKFSDKFIKRDNLCSVSEFVYQISK